MSDEFNLREEMDRLASEAAREIAKHVESALVAYIEAAEGHVPSNAEVAAHGLMRPNGLPLAWRACRFGVSATDQRVRLADRGDASARLGDRAGGHRRES